jgi:hypothetical protein
MEHAVDPEALAKVRANLEVWTSSYRVVERSHVDGSLHLTVEFEIDLPRLSKRLAPGAAPPRQGYELELAERQETCPQNLPERGPMREALIGAGVPLFEGGERLALSFECTDLGRVPASFVHAGRVVLKAELHDGRALRVEAIAFGEDAEHAQLAARDQALARAGSQLQRASSGSSTLRVHGVGDGSRVRRLVQAIEGGVVGVRSVRVSAVEAGGVVRLELRGLVAPEELATRLERLEFPDFNFALLPPAPNPAVAPGAAPDLASSLVIDLEFL